MAQTLFLNWGNWSPKTLTCPSSHSGKEPGAGTRVAGSRLVLCPPFYIVANPIQRPHWLSDCRHWLNFILWDGPLFSASFSITVTRSKLRGHPPPNLPPATDSVRRSWSFLVLSCMSWDAIEKRDFTKWERLHVSQNNSQE